MVNLSSILSAYLALEPDRFRSSQLLLAPEGGAASGASPALLVTIILLVLALKFLKGALEPVSVIVRSLAGAAIAVVFVIAALGLVLVAFITRQ
jgi:hypothetical protein